MHSLSSILEADRCNAMGSAVDGIAKDAIHNSYSKCPKRRSSFTKSAWAFRQDFAAPHNVDTATNSSSFSLLFVAFVGAKDAGKGDQALVALLLSVHDNPWLSIC
jgi:hypothetical protein